MGELPDWYPLIAAARYLGVPPWDLADQPYFWQSWAICAANAEASARQQKADHAS